MTSGNARAGTSTCCGTWEQKDGALLIGLDLRRSNPDQKAPLITYRATLDASRDLAQYLGRLLYAERRDRGTRAGSRALTCYGHAVMGLRWFRQNGHITALACDHGISRATGYRYLDEIITVRAERAPDLRGGNIQALPAPDGFPLWVSDVEPGSVHDLTSAREHVLGALYLGLLPARPLHVARQRLRRRRHRGVHPGQAARRRPEPGPGHPHYNALLHDLRCLGERGFALRHFTTGPRKIGRVVKAALVLTHFEHGRLT